MKIGSRVVINEVDGLPTTHSGSGIIVSAQDKCCDETCLGRMITVRVDKNNPMIEMLGYDHFDVEVCITAVRLQEEPSKFMTHQPRECFYVGVESAVDETAECSGNKATCPRHSRAVKHTVLLDP